MAKCQPFVAADIDSFLELAGREGWVSGRWELEFLLQSYPQGCFVWREAAESRGYLTSIKYGRSAWIGNLLVPPQARRHGIGRGLMERAVSELLKGGAETVWLTASAEGVGLYQKLGFVPIDSINRWSGKAALNRDLKQDPFDLDFVRSVDRVGWGDRRETLLRETCSRGSLHTSSGGFICSQNWQSGTQIGPWGCLISAQAAQLLDRFLVPGDEDFFLDVPAGNFAAAQLLSLRGFSIQGSNILMYLGDRPLYQPGSIYALASMGSMG